MRRRRKTPQDNENLDRWLISYADFITLLFAFFVVMYAISSVNEGKYKVLSSSLDVAFSKLQSSHHIIDSYELTKRRGDTEVGGIDCQSPKINPINLGSPMTTISPIRFSYLVNEEAKKNRKLAGEIELEKSRLKTVSKRLEEIFGPFIDQKMVELKRHELWVELVLKSEILFESGEAELSAEAVPVLKKIAEIIGKAPNTLHVEGHTDNLPISTPKFPSNWELSASRAASVVRLLAKGGVNPANMLAIGYGEFHPVADNTFEEGRKKNRRVVLVLLSQTLGRYQDENEGGIQPEDAIPDTVTDDASPGDDESH
ncbi:MAG: flagellar motor protein MotD [Gammaproteobacteria bacterium]